MRTTSVVALIKLQVRQPVSSVGCIGSECCSLRSMLTLSKPCCYDTSFASQVMQFDRTL